MILDTNGLDTASGLVHVSVHDTGLDVVDKQLGVRKSDRVPEAEGSHLGAAVGGEARTKVEVRGRGRDVDGDSAGGGVTQEVLGRVQRAQQVAVDGLDKGVTVDFLHRLQGACLGGAADDHVDLAVVRLEEAVKGRVKRRLVGDVCGLGVDVHVGEALVEGRLCVEERLLAATEEGDAGGAGGGELAGGLGANARAAAGDDDGLAFGRELGPGGGERGVGVVVPLLGRRREGGSRVGGLVDRAHD